MGAGGQTGESNGAGADNVIRFPRDWFGSKDDLIPIGPAAERLQKEAEARRARLAAATPEPSTVEPESVEPEAVEPLVAGDFWGAESGALHQPVEVPVPAQVPDSGLPSGHPADEATVLFPADGDEASYVVARADWRPRGGRMPLGRLRPLPSAAVVFAVLILASVAMFTVLGTGGHRRPSVAPQSAAVRPDSSFPADALVTLARTASGPSAVTVGKLAPVKRTDRIHRKSHHRSVARRPASRVRSTPHRRSHASSPGGTSGGSSSSQAVLTTDVSSASASVPAAASTSSASVTRASPPASSGPASLGAVVGQQCNPQCSASGSN